MGIERTAHPYIVRDSAIYGGEPIVEGTRIGVRHIILLFQSGKDPEEIARIHRLSLAQVYDASTIFVTNRGVTGKTVVSRLHQPAGDSYGLFTMEKRLPHALYYV